MEEVRQVIRALYLVAQVSSVILYLVQSSVCLHLTSFYICIITNNILCLVLQLFGKYLITVCHNAM